MQLYRSAFVHQIYLRSFRTSLSLHSVIAIFIVVAVALWWGEIDKRMRHIQPFLAMSKEPALYRRGATTSYQTSYWLWASIKAALNKHWLLCLVTVGTTLNRVRKSSINCTELYK
jgi:hypothetical protein